ncbi:MAG: DNA polymerase III subunit alpha [SAR324 cluster bacterium]|nr:DNA polymerase III subunit alpha [SAR324 cluster bacterium]
MSRPFTHLHLHTQYSLLDGAIRIADLPAALQSKGYEGCAVTDHGNLFGAVEFHHKLKAAGLKPIIGVEAYIAKGSRNDRQYDRPGPNASHLVLLCQNREGYRNLIKLISRSYAEGKYYGVPRMDQELLEQYNGGLIALSACLGGVLNKHLLAGQQDEARELARWYGQVFEGRFYVEIQDHGLALEREVNGKLVAIAEELGLPLVGTNDCHYLTPDEAYSHYLLQLMGWQKKVSDPKVEPFTDKQLYLKSPEEMENALASYAPEVFENAARIAEQCDLNLEGGKVYLPKYEVPPSFSEEQYFRKMAQDGLERRLARQEELAQIPAPEREDYRKPYLERLQFELGVITGMKYAGYFLIVADFINWAKDNGVRVGPGRGSGAGSLVAYALRITDLDPLRHGLLFERFLNPERVSMPDFDIDFDVAGRERVIEYVREKYGAEKVCQISTFGSLGAKAALRGVARVLDFPYSQADKIAKLIPNVLNITLEEAIAMEPELARLEREGDEQERKLIANGRALEGLNSNLSTHAAGVIIMDQDITEVMPVCTSSKSDGLQSMYSMKWAEDQGAVKFDFLGLLNLTIIGNALELINRDRPDGPLDIDAIPLDDAQTFGLLVRADTTGVFQLESGGMRRLLSEMKPSAFEDVVAILALYRPGPLEAGMDKAYARRKNGREPVTYPHPLLEPVLRETYGIMVYQEQVIEAARVLAGFTLGEADLLRRAIGKKIPAEMAEQRDKFIQGCAAHGISGGKAEEIFTLIDHFAGYGFNKSHSAAYGLIAYQTAYLKAHYPVQFMAALLSSDMDNTDKVVNFIAECREMGVEVLPPDINRGGLGFTIDGSAVRFGLSAVKNVGENAVGCIIEARDAQPEGRFADLAAFAKSVDLHRVNKRVLEALIKGGAFDSLQHDRARMMAGLEQLMVMGLSHQNEQAQGQETLFDLLGGEETAKVELRVELPEAPPLNPSQRLKMEKEALGFYVSGHPLHRYRSEVSALAVSTNDLREREYADGEEVALAGVVAHMAVRMNRKSEKFAIVKLEDLRGSVEVVVWARVFAEVAGLLALDQPLLIRGKVRANDDELSVAADQVLSLERYRAEEAVRADILCDDAPLDEKRLRMLMGLLAKSPGNCAVRLRVPAANGCQVWIDTGVRFSPVDGVVEELEALLEETALRFAYARGMEGMPRRATAPPPPGTTWTSEAQHAG